MGFDEYRAHDATGLAKLVADKHVSPAELLTLAQARAAAVDPQINAIVRDVPCSAGEGRSGPVRGRAVLIKDIAQDYAGLPSSHGLANSCLCRSRTTRRSSSASWMPA